MIFICDDDPAYTLAFTNALQACLSESHSSERIQSFLNCGDMFNALQALNANQQKPDLIFMDMRMPNVNGAECIKILNEKYVQPVAIVAMSSEISMNELSVLHRYIKAVIPKTCELEELKSYLFAVIKLHLGLHRPKFIL